MKTALSRRELIQAIPGLGLAAGDLLGLPTGVAWADSLPALVGTADSLPALGSAADPLPGPAPGAAAAPWPGFPRQDAELVSEVVGKAHRDEARVRELVVEIQSAGVKPATRALRYVGEDEFLPSGVPSVRFRFAIEEGKAVSVAIRAAESILTAKRVVI